MLALLLFRISPLIDLLLISVPTMLFFFNCTNSFSVNYTKIRIKYASSVIYNSYVALVHGDEDLNWDRTACERLIALPIQFERENNQTINVDYIKLLNDGFSLHWNG